LTCKIYSLYCSYLYIWHMLNVSISDGGGNIGTSAPRLLQRPRVNGIPLQWGLFKVWTMICISTTQLDTCVVPMEPSLTLPTAQKLLTFCVEKERTGTYWAYFTYYVYYAYWRIIFRFRYILRKDQPVYGFWYYFMIHRGISTSLQRVLPKYIPRTEADVDELLGCKVRM
jgi:hypothetical protein